MYWMPFWCFVYVLHALRFLSLRCRMKGPTKSKNSPLLGENGGQEPCIPQVPLQDIMDLRNLSSAGCCRDDGAFFCPRGSVRFRAGNQVHDFYRASAPSELCERPPCSSSHPLRSHMRVSCHGHAVRSLYRGTQCRQSRRAWGSDLVHVWWRDRACRHFLSLSRHLMPALG